MFDAFAVIFAVPALTPSIVPVLSTNATVPLLDENSNFSSFASSGNICTFNFILSFLFIIVLSNESFISETCICGGSSYSFK